MKIEGHCGQVLASEVWIQCPTKNNHEYHVQQGKQNENVSFCDGAYIDPPTTWWCWFHAVSNVIDWSFWFPWWLKLYQHKISLWLFIRWHRGSGIGSISGLLDGRKLGYLGSRSWHTGSKQPQITGTCQLQESLR